MSEQVEAINPLVKGPTETDVGYGINGTAWLPNALTFASASVADISPDDGELTIENVAVNSGTFFDDCGNAVPAGKGITFSASGGTVGVDYRVTFSAPVAGGYDGETRAPVCILQIRDGKP